MAVEAIPEEWTLQVASDLHLEFLKQPLRNWRHVLIPSARALALVGDICELHNRKLWCGLLERLAPYWEAIFVVNGNHEYYVEHAQRPQCTAERLLADQRAWVNARGWSHVHVLERDAVEWGPFRVLGCTLWSYIPVSAAATVRETMNDYRRISARPGHLLAVIDVNRWHQEAVEWLRAELNRNHTHPTIILTHHAPLTRGTSAPEYEVQTHRPVNSAFASDLSALFHPHVKLWAFGHTHHAVDWMFRETRIVSNPRGYHDGDCAFQPTFAVEIDPRVGLTSDFETDE